jgi:hypothetical protein
MDAQHKGQRNQQIPNLITSETFAVVFVDVHVGKMGSIVASDLNHGRQEVYLCKSVAQPVPHCSQPLVGNDIGRNFCSGFAGHLRRMTQHFLAFEDCAGNYVVANDTNMKLM